VGSKYLEAGDYSYDIQEVGSGEFVIDTFGSGPSMITLVTKSTSATLNTFTLEIPDDYYFATNRLVWGVKMISTSGGCIDVFDVTVTSLCKPACSASILEEGDFIDSVTGWSGDAVVHATFGSTHILGRLGAGDVEEGLVQKTVNVEPTSEFTEVELVLAVLKDDSVPPIDVKLTVVSEQGPAPELVLELNTNDDNTGTKVEGITAWTVYTGVNSDGHSLFLLNVIVPNTFYSGGTLTIGVGWESNDSFNKGAFGVVSYKFSTACSEPKGARKLDGDVSVGGSGEQGYSEDEDDNSYYCLAQDYSCDGGDDYVHVCHYSGRLGYQTFCIPESDSEVLRFYSKDYCGPCIGGFTA
jgi:hypothetical protein